MLPPETTATILPRPARPLIAAATAQPAAPSAMTRARSATSRMARATSSRETTIEPASVRSSGHIVSSTDFPPAPYVIEHERLHCQGYEHAGEHELRAILARYLASLHADAGSASQGSLPSVSAR